MFHREYCRLLLVFLFLWAAGSAQAGLLTLKGKEIYVPGEVLVTLKAGIAADAKFRALSPAGSAQALRKADVYKVKLSGGLSVEAAIDQLKKDPAVAAVQPNYRYYALACSNPPSDPYYTLPPGGTVTYWPFVKIHADQAWTNYFSCPVTNTPVTVAILDTGVSSDHPDLPSGIFVQGYNAVQNNNPTTDTEDDFGHGTFVAGIIAAQWDNSGTPNACEGGTFNGGMAGLAGAPGLIKIMPVKVLDNNGSGTSESIIGGMDFAFALGVRIFNISLGGPPDPLEQAEVNTILAGNGIIVAAAGNESGPLDYPAAYPGVISVGATDQNDNVAWYSNFGTGLDLVAPGGYAAGSFDNFNGSYTFSPDQDMFSTIDECPNPADSEFIRSSDSLYGEADGTSFATPMVAGAAALLLALNPGMTNIQVMNRLINTADSLNGNRGWDPHSGYGRLNVYRALQNTQDITPYLNTFNSPNPFSLQSDGSTNITLAIDSPMAVELTIYDTAGETVFHKKYDSSELNDNPSNPQFKSYYVSWDGRNGKGNLVVPGVYFYTVSAGGTVGRNKIVVVKGPFQGTR